MTVKDWFTYHCLRSLGWVVGHIPRSLALSTGRGLGNFIGYVAPVRARTARRNLTLAFPEKSDAERRQILLNCYRHFGMVIMDFFRAQYLTRQQLEALVTVPNSALEQLRSTGRGILISAHLGNWEYILHTMGWLNIPFCAVAYIQKNRGAHRYFQSIREISGSGILDKDGTTAPMIEFLDRGFLGLASDQHAGSRGIWVDFFGHPSSTPTGAAYFAHKTRSAILFTVCIRRGDRYELEVQDISPDYEKTGPRKTIYQQINQRYMNVLEEAIRRNPEQYFWFHRRWRNIK